MRMVERAAKSLRERLRSLRLRREFISAHEKNLRAMRAAGIAEVRVIAIRRDWTCDVCRSDDG